MSAHENMEHAEHAEHAAQSNKKIALLIAVVGVAAVYAGNALAFLLVVVLVARWKAPQRARVASPERLAGATRAGIRYARASLELRAVLYRTALGAAAGVSLSVAGLAGNFAVTAIGGVVVGIVVMSSK